MHWLGGDVKLIDTKKECFKWIKKNEINSKSPIYYAFPVDGVVIHKHIHEVTHVEKIMKPKKAK